LPYYLLYGREIAGPTDKFIEAYIRSKNKPSDAQEAVKELAKKLKEARKLAWDNIRKGKAIQKKYDNRKAKLVEFQEGQLVYRKEMANKAKLKEKWIGPYKVLKKISEQAYKLEGRYGKPITVNVEQLKLCRSTKEEVRKRKCFRTQHRLMDKDTEHSEISDSEGDSTEQEDSFSTTGTEPCTLMEGLIAEETQEDINGKDLNSEPSNVSERHSQINCTGNGEPGDEAKISGTRESQYYFFLPRKNIPYRY
jgi:hypothetical protein